MTETTREQLTAYFTSEFYVRSDLTSHNMRLHSAPVVGKLVTTEGGIVCLIEGRKRYVPWAMIRYIDGLT